VVPAAAVVVGLRAAVVAVAPPRQRDGAKGAGWRRR
jgi:hypothetical protein